jgi:hypothetical protein
MSAKLIHFGNYIINPAFVAWVEQEQFEHRYRVIVHIVTSEQTGHSRCEFFNDEAKQVWNELCADPK